MTGEQDIEGAAATRIRVLVAEDEIMINLAMTDTLESAGFEVLSAGNAEDALALAQANVLDAAVVNLRLGTELVGRDLIIALRVREPGLPVVVVTGYHPSYPEANLRGVGGPTARLQKPGAAEELVAALRGVLARRGQPQDGGRRREDGISPAG